MNHSSEASKTQKSTVEKVEKRQPSEEYRSEFANRHLSPRSDSRDKENKNFMDTFQKMKDEVVNQIRHKHIYQQPQKEQQNACVLYTDRTQSSDRQNKHQQVKMSPRRNSYERVNLDDLSGNFQRQRDRSQTRQYLQGGDDDRIGRHLSP